MKRIAVLIAFLSLTINLLSQDNVLQFKFDSIIQEANTLYNYEKAAWNASDLLKEGLSSNSEIGGYVAYHIDDTIIVVYSDINQVMSIAKFRFLNSNLAEPFEMNFDAEVLNDAEYEFFSMKQKILNGIIYGEYEISIPEGYNPNFILIKGQGEYRFYIIMGATKAGVIPFGNDYLFTTDNEGNIMDYKKFHTNIIPTFSKYEDLGTVTSAMHSHIKSTPYITATDICTFRLYAHYTDLVEFKVYSTALGITMRYDLEKNKIELVE
jgi:hypothetical protein